MGYTVCVWTDRGCAAEKTVEKLKIRQRNIPDLIWIISTYTCPLFDCLVIAVEVKQVNLMGSYLFVDKVNNAVDEAVSHQSSGGPW